MSERFANDKARIVVETSQKVTEAKNRLGKDEINFEPIYFDKSTTEGLTVVFTAGQGAFVSGSYYVPERTRTILQELGIPYKEGFKE